MSGFGSQVAATVRRTPGWDAHPDVRSGGDLSLGERAADKVRNAFGSWAFIGIQTIVITLWVGVNGLAYALRWDPYPFILLNLFLSTQATYAAPIILLSQKRADAVASETAAHDLASDLRSEELLKRIEAAMATTLPVITAQLTMVQTKLAKIENDR